MNRILLTLAMASILATGCGRAALDPMASTSPAQARTLTAEAPPAPVGPPGAELSLADAALASAPGARVPGDFVVYRFSGSFRKVPLTLTERVIDRRGAVLTIDFTAEEGDKKQELRVKLDESRHEVVGVARLEGGVEKAATLEVYEALMARTVLAADQNQAFLGTEDVTLELGGVSLPCRKTSYQVRVGKKVGTLRTWESHSFAWGDVGGEITTATGKVLYRAEVVDTGHEEPKGAAMATSDPQ
jgi:hypothetical protein